MTEDEQRLELAGGDKRLARAIKDCQDTYAALGGRLARAYEGIGCVPASGVDEVRGGSTGPSAEKALDLVLSFPKACHSWLYGE